MYYPSKEQFLKLSSKGNLIPVYKEILGDLDTPVSAYFKIAERSKYSFLLESVEGEEKVARFSFMAKDPDLVLRTKGKKAEVLHCRNKKILKQSQTIKDTPLDFVREIMSQYTLVTTPDIPRFCGGMVGYISYDMVRFIERLPNKPKDDLDLPDAVLILAKEVVIFDHLNHKINVVSCAHIDAKGSRASKLRQYSAAIRKIEKLVSELNRPLKKAKHRSRTKRTTSLKVRSNYDQKQFEKIVNTAKKNIRQGEIIQAVLSQRFSVDIHTDPFNIYRSLRSVNPSPYMYYLNLDKIKIVGSSPELLVRCEDNKVVTRPIAGTRPRGKTEKEDDFLAKDLLADPKERAEHIMLVDLGRNDLGRVCKKGTVKLSEFMSIEKYSHVMHIVSNVVGNLKKGKDSIDVLKSSFPAGTVSGAPKIRAMEIIDEVESLARGPYAGCIGYFSFSGNLDTCITIRTIVVAGKKAYVQAGAGIVADSNPKKEYQETVNKAKAQIAAIQLAHNHF